MSARVPLLNLIPMGLAVVVWTASSASTPPSSSTVAEAVITTGPRAWALATTALLTHANGDRHDVLPPDGRADSSTTETRRLLHDWWGVDTRGDLLETLDRLDGGGGHRAVFQEKGRVYVAMTEAQFQAALREAAKRPHDVRRMKLVREYYAKHRDNSFLGWDYSRYIMLCRWGYEVGFLRREEAWNRMIPAARKIQTGFHSWAELGEDYLVGRELWSPKETAKSGQYYRDTEAWMVRDRRTAWNRLPWAMDLGSPATR